MREMSLEDIKRVELDALIFFADKCKKNGLKYGLTSGTLLGAVRHGGFIPWDDDIDVIMPRNDYLRFIQLNKEEDWGKYKVFSPYDNKSSVYEYTKLMNTDTILIEGHDKIESHVYMDIFPVDGVSKNRLLRKIQSKCVKFLQIIYAATRRAKYKKSYGNIIERMGWSVINLLSGSHKKSITLALIDKMSHIVPFDKADYAAVIIGQGEKEVFEKEEYMLDGKVMFENHEFNTYRNPKKYLAQFFGDYMKLPPEEQRKGHDNKAWFKD